ncbi:MAG: NAD(P)H-binding protein, partial [Gammaproteobacteria bacterium]
LGTTLRAAGSQPAFERVDYHMVVDLARATHKAGAKRFFVVSSVGASEHAAAFYSRVKGRMEGAVRALPFEAVHIVRPSLLLGERAERRPGEKLAQLGAPLLGPLLVGPLARYRAVPAADVADALVRLARGTATGPQVHHLPLT